MLTYVPGDVMLSQHPSAQIVHSLNYMSNMLRKAHMERHQAPLSPHFISEENCDSMYRLGLQAICFWSLTKSPPRAQVRQREACHPMPSFWEYLTQKLKLARSEMFTIEMNPSPKEESGYSGTRLFHCSELWLIKLFIMKNAGKSTHEKSWYWLV